MEKHELSTNEMLVLYGLARFPEEHAVQVAKKLGIPQPTFSNVVRRLTQKKEYSLVGLPDLQRLGLELIGVVYGSYNPVSTDRDRRNLEVEMRQRYPEIFFMVSGVHQVLILLASCDFAELNKILEAIEKSYVERGLMEGNAITKATFPLGDTYIARWFDYSNPLFIKFKLKEKGITPPTTVRPFDLQALKLSDLHANECRVLVHLLENPGASDVKMAKALALSRTTVAKAKTRLISDGLFMRALIPDLSKIGFEVFVFSETEFTSETTIKQRVGSTEWLLGTLPITLSIISNKRAHTLYAFETYHDFQELKRVALSEYVAKGYIQGDVKTIIYSSSEMIAQPEPNFAPLLRKVLKLDTE